MTMDREQGSRRLSGREKREKSCGRGSQPAVPLGQRVKKIGEHCVMQLGVWWGGNVGGDGLFRHSSWIATTLTSQQKPLTSFIFLNTFPPFSKKTEMFILWKIHWAGFFKKAWNYTSRGDSIISANLRDIMWPTAERGGCRGRDAMDRPWANFQRSSSDKKKPSLCHIREKKSRAQMVPFFGFVFENFGAFRIQEPGMTTLKSKSGARSYEPKPRSKSVWSSRWGRRRRVAQAGGWQKAMDCVRERLSVDPAAPNMAMFIISPMSHFFVRNTNGSEKHYFFCCDDDTRRRHGGSQKLDWHEKTEEKLWVELFPRK